MKKGVISLLGLLFVSQIAVGSQTFTYPESSLESFYLLSSDEKRTDITITPDLVKKFNTGNLTFQVSPVKGSASPATLNLCSTNQFGGQSCNLLCFINGDASKKFQAYINNKKVGEPFDLPPNEYNAYVNIVVRPPSKDDNVTKGIVHVDVPDQYKSSIQTIWYDKNKNPEVKQTYIHDDRIVLHYILNPKKAGAMVQKFPEDFLLEVPRIFVPLDPKKRLDEVVVLGSHNNYTNKEEGYLYYQQGESTYNQYARGGARMLRPAWHNPSGSLIDSPNNEPILCHADDKLCKTVSLATRGFKPHKIVKDELVLFANILNKEKQKDILILDVNNYLTIEETDAQILAVPDFAKLVISQADLMSPENKAKWGGFWPTIEWMLESNKRVIIFSDKGDSKYTFGYYTYLRVNQYGTSDVNAGALPRKGSMKSDFYKDLGPHALVELSWFQDISIKPDLIVSLNSAVDFYNGMKAKISSIPSFIRSFIPDAVTDFAAKLSLPSLSKALNYVFAKLSWFKKIPGVSSLLDMISNKQAQISDAITDIQAYVPDPQDNSLKTLLELIVLSRKSGVIPVGGQPNIIMLDFSTTDGDGIVAANLMNFLNDKANFAAVGGYAMGGKQIAIPAGLVE